MTASSSSVLPMLMKASVRACLKSSVIMGGGLAHADGVVIDGGVTPTTAVSSQMLLVMAYSEVHSSS